MTLITGLDKLVLAQKPSVASIGNFDGVHLGHQHVIDTLLKQAENLALPATVITFEPLAREFFAPSTVRRLTSLDERAQLLFELGVDQVLVIPFVNSFTQYSPEKFILDVLVEGLNVRHLSVGDDFKFGHKRVGDFAMLKRFGVEHGFDVVAHETYLIDELRVSSGRVRNALQEGDFQLAHRLLGRAYSISGVISRGQQLGRTIDYPTANIVLGDVQRAISGVFAVKVHYDGVQYKGVANLGNRPTVDGTEQRLEAHLFDFDQDIYDQSITVEFVQKIREEQKFESFDVLRKQIDLDAESARKILSETA